jgi:uncharacterized protein YbbC (DUF1343 family)
VHVTDRDALRPVVVALHLLSTVRRISGECFRWNTHLDKLAGSSMLRTSLDAQKPVREIVAGWAEFQNAFTRTRAGYLLYN